MTLDTQTVGAAIVMFVAALTRSTFGFGEALVAMPLLALVLDDVRIATALVAISSIFNGLLILVSAPEGTDWRNAWRLIVGCLLGIPVGVYVLIHVPESIVKMLLAAVLIAFSIYSLVRPRSWHLDREIWAYPFGFAAGILGGAYNTSGPALVIFGALRGWTPTQFRSTLQGVFLPNAAVVLLMHYSTGLWSSDVFHFLKWSLPGVCLSVPLGYWLNRRIHPQHFQKFLYGLLMVLALMLLWSTMG